MWGKYVRSIKSIFVYLGSFKNTFEQGLAQYLSAQYIRSEYRWTIIFKLLPSCIFSRKKMDKSFFAPWRWRSQSDCQVAGSDHSGSHGWCRRRSAVAPKATRNGGLVGTLAPLRPRPPVRTRASIPAGPAVRWIHSSSFRSSWRSDAVARGTGISTTVNDQRQIGIAMSVIAAATRGGGW